MTKILTLIEIKNNTVSALVKNGIVLSEALLETEILLNFVFGTVKKDLILDPDKILPADKSEIFKQLINRRIKEKIPVQYLTNKAYFMGEEFYVDENVLIPRPETEILVEEVLRHCEERNEEAVFLKIIDIGTGSGCIAGMIAKNSKSTKVFAVDISEKALEVAKLNAERLGVKDKITFILSDIFENINIDEKFDVIVSNPPYISINEKPLLQSEVVIHEPHLALFADDEKGISFYEKLVFQSYNRLNKNGYLAVEIGIYQSESVAGLFKKAGLKEIKIIKDYNKIDRFITGRHF